jgi:pyridoxal phosphate enzyme (YggS family)
MMNETTRSRLESNWQAVQNEVHEAADRCDRAPDSITIVGVSKYVDVELTKALFAAGCVNLGESRPQSLWKKAEEFDDDAAVNWHLIGHLQRNKVRRTLPIQPLIHSVDSQRLVDALSEEAQAQAANVRCLLEVNVSGDDAKTGMSRAGLHDVLSRLPISGVQVQGLMAMAGWGTDPDDARRQFDQVRQLRDELEQQFDLRLPELSMGMSGDFAQAIAAGATMVRIGSRLFDGIIQR